MYLLRGIAKSNGLNRKSGEIDLRNLERKLWSLGRTNGQTCINAGCRNFCFESRLEAGSFYKFKFVRNGTLCSKPNGKYHFSGKPSSEGLENTSMEQNKFLKMTFKLYMFTSGQLCLPRPFVRDNRIKEGEEITLVDKDGVKWPSYVACSNENERFYLAKGWRSFCVANMLTSGESFTLEFVREGTTPMIKFCSKGKVKVQEALNDESPETVQASEDEEEAPEERDTRFKKKAPGLDTKNLQCKQPLEPLTISDHVKKVKQSILDTLNGVKRFRSELKIKEQNLEASLKDIDALGKRVLEINKIIK